MALPLILIFTYKCNLNCVYCPIFKKKDFIEKETALKAIDLYCDYLGSAQGKIKIFGGEPFLKKDLLLEIINYIRKKNPEIQIELTTNGILLENAILNYFKKQKFNLSISLDGDKKTQLLNRSGTSPLGYEKILNFIKNSPLQITVNMVICPNTVNIFFQNFLYLYNSGVRKFNFLPAAYLFWSQKKLELLEQQFELISFFLQNHPEIYIKNVDIDNDLFFFNTGIVVDTNGDIFFTNAVMVKELQKIKQNLKIANVKDLDSFNFLTQLDIKREKQKVASAIRNSFNPRILKTNQALDGLMDNFVEKIEINKTKNKRVDIKIGYQCNNHCLFCVQGNKREKCQFRNEKEIKKDLIEARKTCNSIVFTGGEPTIHPDFLKLVHFAKKLDFKTIQIQTNGRLFAYLKFCQETIKAGANEFSPALHGHTPALHDYLTAMPGSFKQTVQGIKNLKSLGQPILTNTVINKFNYRHLPEIAKLLVFLDVDQFQFAFLHIVGSAWKNRDFLVPKKSEIMPYIKKGLNIGILADKRVMTEAIPLCFMKGYEQYIAEKIIPEAMVIENKFKIDDYKKYRINQGKAKGPKCKDCLYFSICEGPWREYPEIFGWDEFIPVVNNK